MIEQVDSCKAVYENRVVVFIDLLGFRELVSLSALHPETAEHIHNFLADIQQQKVMDGLYGSIPTLGMDGTIELKPVRDANIASRSLKKHWPIEITQFSDSLVLSCKAEDGMTAGLLFEYIANLMLAAFQLGFLLRGGSTVGLLSHQEGGPLFGPAFIEAYALESKHAQWPRIVVDKAVFDLLVRTEQGLPKPKPIGQLFSDCNEVEGKCQLTLATAYRYLDAVGARTLDVEATTAKLMTLVQTYATDEKLAWRYGALLHDWLSAKDTVAHP